MIGDVLYNTVMFLRSLLPRRWRRWLGHKTGVGFSPSRAWAGFDPYDW